MPLLRSLIFFACSIVLVHAQEDAQSLHKRLVEQFSNAQSIRLVASSSALNNAKITISAKRKDKYLLELADRKIFCNGTTIWNYTPSKKSVVVSSYSSQGTSLSVEKLLLELIAAYKPSSLKSQLNSENGSTYQLLLEPEGAAKYGVKSMLLGIDKKTLNLKTIVVQNDQGKQDWSITSLQRNVELKDALFTFKVPKGVEVIDLRN